jgi:hypothetical protein
MPTIEVRFQNLEAEAEVRVGSSGLPTVLNSIVNTVEEAANALKLLPSRKQTMPILHNVSGIIKPRRYWNKMIAIHSFFLLKNVKLFCIYRGDEMFLSTN